MSDDFDFNRDDLFDDFGDDDDFGGNGGDEFDFDSDNFDFGDEGDDFDMENDDFGSDFDSALGGDDGGDDEFDQVQEEQSGGTNPAFIIGMVIMGILMLAGLGLIVYIAFFRVDPQQVAMEETRSAIETRNAVVSTQIVISETAAVENATATEGAIQTATAQYTPPTETPTPTLTPTEDFTATTVAQTQDALNFALTAEQQAINDANATATTFQQTLEPVEFTATPETVIIEPSGESSEEPMPQGETSVPLPAVQQTATALALLFGASPTPEELQATSVVDGGTAIPSGSGSGGIATGTGTGTTTGGQGGGALPNTGLFDEVFQGNPAFIFLAAFGLLGVIVVSRVVRGNNRKEED